MFTYLTKIKAFIPLMPPMGDLPNSESAELVENLSWENEQGEEIKFIFPHPIRKYDKTTEKELHNFFNYTVEITTKTDTIEDAANRSIFLLEQVLDTSSFFSQAASKIVELVSIVNLTQIEEIIKNKKGSYEKGIFKKQRIAHIKSFPPGKMVFLTEHGVKNIGRNLFWFRRGLSEFSTINRFVSFFTALKELDYFFKREYRKDNSFPSSVKNYVDNFLKAPTGSFDKWRIIRNRIVHFSDRETDYRTVYKDARENLSELYRYCYYAIAKFLTDKPPPPIPIVFYEDVNKVIVDATPEIVEQLTSIWIKRHKGYKEIKI